MNSTARVKLNLKRLIPMSKNKRFVEKCKYVINNKHEKIDNIKQNANPYFMILLIFESMRLKLSINCLTIIKSPH